MALSSRWTADEDAELKRLRGEGLTYPQIAMAIGRPAASVKTRARDIGVAGAADKPWTDADLAVLATLRDEGRTNVEIAERLGRTQHAVAKRVSLLGFDRLYRPLEERFWEKVERGAPDECWPWLGARDMKGYGAFMLTGPDIKKRRVTASRVAYELVNGTIPHGHAVMHRCDNPPCCNPAHLATGTIADNNRDMVSKGRHWRHART